MNEFEFHPPMIYPDMILPAYGIFHQVDIPSYVSNVSKFLVQSSNQKSLALWYWSVSPTRKFFCRLQAAYSYLEMRLAHISSGHLNGSHKPFDINSKFIIGFQPNAFLKTLLPSFDDGMSKIYNRFVSEAYFVVAYPCQLLLRLLLCVCLDFLASMIPVSHPVPRSILAWNCPGPADTFCSRNPALFSIKGTQKLGKQ